MNKCGNEKCVAAPTEPEPCKEYYMCKCDIPTFANMEHCMLCGHSKECHKDDEKLILKLTAENRKLNEIIQCLLESPCTSNSYGHNPQCAHEGCVGCDILDEMQKHV